MPPMPPMLLMLPMLRLVGFTSPLAEDGYTMVTQQSPIQAELEISLLKWWSLQAFVDT